MNDRSLLLVGGGTALIAGTYGLARYGFGLFLPQIREDFALTATTAGTLGTAGLGSYCVAVVVARKLVARRAALTSVLLAGSTAAIGCVGIALVPSGRPWSTLVLGGSVLLAGLGAGLASVGLVDLVQRQLRPDRTPRAQAVINSGTGAGVLVAGVVALGVGDAWRVAWLGFAVLLVAALVTTMSAASRVDTTARQRDEADSPAPGWAGLGRPLAAAGLLGMSSAAVWTFGRDLVVTRGGLDVVDSTLFWTTLGAAGLLGAAAGDLVSRTDVRRAWLGLAPVLAAATAALGLVPGRLPVALVAGGAFGAAYVALTGVLIAWAIEIDANAAGRGVALLFGVLAAGQAVGAAATGVLIDVFGSPQAFTASAVLMLASCGVAAGARRRRPRAPSARSA